MAETYYVRIHRNLKNNEFILGNIKNIHGTIIYPAELDEENIDQEAKKEAKEAEEAKEARNTKTNVSQQSQPSVSQQSQPSVSQQSQPSVSQQSQPSDEDQKYSKLLKHINNNGHQIDPNYKGITLKNLMKENNHLSFA
jgi:predicted ATP-dependent endonuclease of OLD family